MTTVGIRRHLDRWLVESPDRGFGVGWMPYRAAKLFVRPWNAYQCWRWGHEDTAVHLEPWPQGVRRECLRCRGELLRCEALRGMVCAEAGASCPVPLPVQPLQPPPVAPLPTFDELMAASGRYN